MWPEKYIGRNWVNGEYDCWQFVRDVYKQEMNIELPVFNINALDIRQIQNTFNNTSEYDNWQEIALTELQDNDVILCGKNKNTHHIGIWFKSGIVHNVENKGVVYQTPQSLKQHGWNMLNAYRRKH